MNSERLRRRACVLGLIGLATGAGVFAQAPAYPARPVRVVVAFTAGGTTDILARAVAQQLSERLKQAFVIDNKPGGGGNIGTESVVRAAPDGYTLIVNSVGPMAVNQTLYKTLSYDPLKDLVPVVQIADVPNVLVVPASLPVTTFDEFIAYAKANPGKLRALAVSSVAPSRALPGVPTVAEKGFPGFAAGSWFGFFAPKGTPEPVTALLNKTVNEILPTLEEQMVREGADPVGGSPAQFGQFTQKEYDKWKVIVRDSGATAE